MFKGLFNFLDRMPEDKLNERIFREKVVSKYYLYLGLTFIFLCLYILSTIFLAISKRTYYPAVVYNVLQNKGEIVSPPVINQIPVTLPSSHQSFKNVTSWLIDAITALYTFDFLTYDKSVGESSFYFTEKGYQKYIEALKSSGVPSAVIKDRLIASIVPTSDPIVVSTGNQFGVNYWRFYVPVLISYSGGKEAVLSKYMIDVTVEQVPAYISHKGLAISNISMKLL